MTVWWDSLTVWFWTDVSRRGYNVPQGEGTRYEAALGDFRCRLPAGGRAATDRGPGCRPGSGLDVGRQRDRSAGERDDDQPIIRGGAQLADQRARGRGG